MSADTTTSETRIYCIGDSITHGRKGAPGDPALGPVLSYRYPLFKLLIDHGVRFRFVGGSEGGFGGPPFYEPYRGQEFDNVHEGYWGWSTSEVADRVVVHARDVEPDIAIVMLGAHDQVEVHGVEPSAEAMSLICEDLRLANPKVRVLIGLPYLDSEPMPKLAHAFAELAAQVSTSESPVVAVSTGEGWINDPNAPGACTLDGALPNSRGDAHLAARFFEAMREWIESEGITT